MTLILSCLTPKYIVQVSDRRLTWPDGSVADDSANKAIIFHNHACFSYTGIAQIGSQRTDEWIAEQLLDKSNLTEAITHLKAALDVTIRKLRFPNRHLTIVIDCWGSQEPDKPDRSWSIALSNMIDPLTRKYCDTPLPIFRQFNQVLPEGKGYAFLALGQVLDVDVYKAMVRQLVRAMRHASPTPTTVLPGTVGRFMQDAIRKMANRNGTVGKNLMTTILLNRQLPEFRDMHNQFSYSDQNKEPIVCAPILITPGISLKGFKWYPGPPRKKK